MGDGFVSWCGDGGKEKASSGRLGLGWVSYQRCAQGLAPIGSYSQGRTISGAPVFFRAVSLSLRQPALVVYSCCSNLCGAGRRVGVCSPCLLRWARCAMRDELSVRARRVQSSRPPTDPSTILHYLDLSRRRTTRFSPLLLLRCPGCLAQCESIPS